MFGVYMSTVGGSGTAKFQGSQIQFGFTPIK